MKKRGRRLFILLISVILLVGIAFAGEKLIKERKIKDIKDIDCNKKLKLKDGDVKVDLIEDLINGGEVFKLYND